MCRRWLRDNSRHHYSNPICHVVAVSAAAAFVLAVELCTQIAVAQAAQIAIVAVAGVRSVIFGDGWVLGENIHAINVVAFKSACKFIQILDAQRDAVFPPPLSGVAGRLRPIRAAVCHQYCGSCGGSGGGSEVWGGSSS